MIYNIYLEPLKKLEMVDSAAKESSAYIQNLYGNANKPPKKTG